MLIDFVLVVHETEGVSTEFTEQLTLCHSFFVDEASRLCCRMRDCIGSEIGIGRSGDVDRALDRGYWEVLVRMDSVSSCVQILLGEETVRELFGSRHSLSKSLILEQVPDAPAAGTGEQPQLAGARSPTTQLQHWLRIGTGQPPSFGHCLLLAHRGSPSPSAVPGGYPIGIRSATRSRASVETLRLLKRLLDRGI